MSKEPTALSPPLSQGLPLSLEFQQVSISFASRVLDKVSFSISPGETACILGRSGVGKSVCLRIMMGFLKPDEGRVIVEGEDITALTEEELGRLHKKMTMVFQSGALFDSLTLAENVAYPLEERQSLSEEEIERIVNGLLERVGVLDLRDQLPSEVSVGAKRAVAIARALALSPKAILYDEPTTMVDPLMARRLTQLIARLRKESQLTNVVVTHDMRVVERLADRVIFLDQERVVFNGTVAEMERSNVPVVRQFLILDRLDLNEVVRTLTGKRGSEDHLRRFA